MRTLIALIISVLGTGFGSLAMAAELVGPPPVLPPPVEDGLDGVFYLRGSIDVNAWWARDVEHGLCPCTVPIVGAGYGYSFGVGAGFETSEGLRFDVTLDRIVNYGMTDGTYSVDMTTTLALMNAYFDFGLSGNGPPVSGEMGAYVGAGLGLAYNQTVVSGPLPLAAPGNTFSGAAAVMAGVTYDMGQAVIDVGYRGVYMPQVTNGNADPNPYYINQNIIHELRGTVRYRFN